MTKPSVTEYRTWQQQTPLEKKAEMFRKHKKKMGKPANLRRKRSEDDENDISLSSTSSRRGDDTVGTVQEAIRQTQKKHKILASLPLATGGTGSKHNKKGIGTLGRPGPDEETQQREQQSLYNGELSVLASKHQQNMEEFIEKQIEATAPKNAKQPAEDNFKAEPPKNNPNDDEDLYRQLSRETYRGNHTSDDLPRDDDKGAGGAMLAGSGIAEVILPIQTRLGFSSPIGNVAKNKNQHMTSSSAVPEGSTEVLPLTTPTPFGRRMIQQQQQETSQRGTNPNESHVEHQTVSSVDQIISGVTASSPDDGRAGFDAYRGKSAPQHAPNDTFITRNSRGTNNYRKNRDDQVFSNFVQRHFDGNRR